MFGISISGVLGKFSLETNANLEWYRNAQSHLVPRNVIIWDTHLPVAYAANQRGRHNSGKKHTSINKVEKSNSSNAAMYKKYSLNLFPQEAIVACSDRVHGGFASIYVYVQLLINFVCN